MTSSEKIVALRQKMSENNIDAFIIYSADPHMSEYLPAEWQERTWLSGFSGSAGFVVITKNKGGLWTDGRYFVQAPQELEGSGIDLFKEGKELLITSTGLIRKFQKTDLSRSTPSQLPTQIGNCFLRN